MNRPQTALASERAIFVRRARLRELDALLESLELLNLNDLAELPPTLRTRLEAEGIAYGPQIPIPQLIEQVLECQRPFLLPMQGQRWDLVADDEDEFER